MDETLTDGNAVSDVVVLNLVEPGRGPRLVVVSNEAVVGRRGDDIALDDPESSRRHARLRMVENGLEVTDLGSRNGTFVNGHRIAGPTVIVEGGWIDVGGCRFLWDDDVSPATVSTDPQSYSGASGSDAAIQSVKQNDLVDAVAAPQKESTWRGPLIFLALGIGLLVVGRMFFVQSFKIPSQSMDPTLQKGDQVIAITHGVQGATPTRGDVMIFKNPLFPKSSEDRFLVKRVIGIPGDIIVFADGELIRNGKVVHESWVPNGMPTDNFDSDHRCTQVAPCVVGEKTVWMMGDNRTDSFDSRGFGPVSTSALVGRVTMRFWPLGRFGGL